jgi:uncharacterized protein
MIRETIVTTRRPDGTAHIAPMGIHVEGESLIIAPFRPSATLENLLREPHAVLNFTDDVRVYAGCLTGRRDWPVVAAEQVPGLRLRDSLAHAELTVERCEDDSLRPRFYCKTVKEAMHAPFHGFNRAQAAVIEAAILASRLDRLPPDKIQRELDYLTIAMEKTAGPREREAWTWLIDFITRHQSTPKEHSV